MKSYTQLRNMFGLLCNNSSSANLTFGDILINDSLRRVYAMSDWDFLQKSATASTVGGTQFYTLPFDYGTLIDVTITIGSTKYVPRECPSQEYWDILNQTTTFQSNFPEWFYIFNGQLGFYPTPSSSTSNAITYNYRRQTADLNAADYVTGTVSATNGSTTITGSGTTWTTPMIGRYIQITATDVAASAGDNVWYQIAGVASATSATLVKAYNGTSMTGGAFTIGQMPILPEEYHDMPVYDAASVFFTSINPDVDRAQMFKAKYEEFVKLLKYDHGTKTSDPSIHDNYPRAMQNPNLYISL